MAGQGTLALELLEDAPAPEKAVIDVEAERFASIWRALRGSGPEYGISTVAEGIAVKTPGRLALPVIRRHVRDLLLVGEDALERAVLLLLEIEKTVVEGAGAAGLAALLAHRDRFRGRRVAIPRCGGNIDLMILASVIQRGLVRDYRLVRIAVEIPDVPGALGEICRLLGDLDSNVLDLQHQRAFAGSSVRATGVVFTLQLRGEEQIETVLEVLSGQGDAAQLLEPA